MCILIVAPKGTIVPDEHLKESSKANPDGAGLAWKQNNKIVTFKSLNQDLVIRKYKSLVAQDIQSDILLHFRVKTTGNIKLQNIHPFYVRENVVMGHNGVIDIDEHKDQTDSQTFGMRFRKFNYRDPLVQELFKKYISLNSKIAYLDLKGYTIINEEKGIWVDGVWYSNNSFKKITPPVQYAYPSNYYPMGAYASYKEGQYMQEMLKEDLVNGRDNVAKYFTIPQKEVVFEALWKHSPHVINYNDFTTEFDVVAEPKLVLKALNSLTKKEVQAIKSDLDLRGYGGDITKIIQALKQYFKVRKGIVAFSIY